MPKYRVETDRGTFMVELDRAPSSDAELRALVEQQLAGPVTDAPRQGPREAAQASKDAGEGFWASAGTAAKGAAGDTVDFVKRAVQLVTGQQKPESAQDVALMTLALSGPIGWAGRAGAAVGVPAFAGRAAAATGAATGQQIVRGDEPTPLVNAGAALVGEGAGALVSKALGAFGGSADAIKLLRDKIAAHDRGSVAVRSGQMPGNLREFEMRLRDWMRAPTSAARDFETEQMKKFLGGIDPSWGATPGKTFGDYVADFGVKIPFGTYFKPSGAATLGAMAPTIPVSPQVSGAARAASDAIGSPAGRASFDVLAEEAAGAFKR